MSTVLNVPMVDLLAQHEEIREEIREAMARVVESQHFIGGEEVEALEEKVAALCGTTHAVACASGTDALMLSLEAAGVGPGDQVICPAYSFFATAGAIARLGAHPVFADVDPATLNMDPASAYQAGARCGRLRALLPVDLFGRVAELSELLEFASAHDVVVVEDAAQAIAARDDSGSPAGSRTHAGCFSFFPSKNLGAFGDAGIVTTSSDTLAERLRMLRNHGLGPDGQHHVVGTNSRLDALQAAVLRVKLDHLEAWTKRRAENASFYDRHFRDAGGAATQPAQGALPLATPPPATAPARHAYNQYVVRVPGPVRDRLRDHLAERGIETRVYYERGLHREACFAPASGSELPALPETDRACRENLALPVHPALSPEQLGHVATTIVDFLRR